MTDVENDRKKWVKFGLILFTVLVLAAVVWSMVPSAITFGVFTYVVDRVVASTGWSRRLVSGCVTLGIVPLGWAITHVLGLRLRERMSGFFRPTAAQRRRKLAAETIIVLYSASYFFLMYVVSRNTNFESIDGTSVAVRWVALTPEGCEFFEEPGVHPKYGTPLERVTPALVAKCDQIAKNDTPRPIPIESIEQVQFFDPIRGTPLVFYYQRPDKRFDLFSRAGVHPLYGTPLTPVDGPTIEKIREQLASDAKSKDDRRHADAVAAHRAEVDRRRQRYITSNNQGPYRAALITVAGDADDSMTQRFAQAVKASSGVLTSLFVSDGLFKETMAGNYRRLRELEMERVMALMVLGDLRSHTNNSVVEGQTVFTSTAQMRIVLLRLSDGYAADSFSVDGKSSAYSVDAAERRAADQAASLAMSRLASYR